MAYLKKSGGFKPRGSFGAARGFAALGERFQAVCNQCHNKCEVPFRPNGKKPVYCRDCFKGKEETPSYSPRSFSREREPESVGFAKRLDVIEAKLDRILKSLG